MALPLVLFLIGVLGFVLNRRNLILLLITADGYNDATGQTFGVYIIVVAGAESAIGLGILVSYYRLRGTIALPAV